MRSASTHITNSILQQFQSLLTNILLLGLACFTSKTIWDFDDLTKLYN